MTRLTAALPPINTLHCACTCRQSYHSSIACLKHSLVFCACLAWPRPPLPWARLEAPQMPQHQQEAAEKDRHCALADQEECPAANSSPGQVPPPAEEVPAQGCPTHPDCSPPHYYSAPLDLFHPLRPPWQGLRSGRSGKPHLLQVVR